MATNSNKSRRGEDFDPKLYERFRPRRLSEIASTRPQQWLIGGVLPAAALVELYAPPGAGKTFLALDCGLCLATGEPWLGHATRACRVAYVYTEGQAGLRQRTEAWFVEHGEHLRPIADENFIVFERPVNLRDPREVMHFVGWLHDFQPDVIVIDTLTNCFGSDGNQNQTQDMTAFVASCTALRERFPGVTVWVLHHTGKDESRGDRGSNALHGAVDMQQRLTHRGENSGKLTLTVTKLRDGVRHEPLALQLVPVGESCVIRAGNGAAGSTGKAKAKARPEDKAFAVLVELGPGPVPEKDWREATGKGRTTFDRHRDKLLEAGRVERSADGCFRVVEIALPTNQSEVAGSPSTPISAMPDEPSQLSEMHERLLLGLVLRGAKGLSEQVALYARCSNEIRSLHARCPDRVTFEAGCWRASPMVIEELRPSAKEYVLQKLEDGMTEAEWIERIGNAVNREFAGELIEELAAEGVVEPDSGGQFHNVRPLPRAA